jgi:hypothetical protein
MPSPRPITWWHLQDQELPIFSKLVGEPVWVIGEDGESILEVMRASRLLTPLFSIQEEVGEDYPSILEQIQSRLEALVLCGSQEGPESRLYGVIRTHAIRDTLTLVTVGLAFSNHLLEPYFRERFDQGYRRMRAVDCSLWSLPVYEGPPPPPELPIKRVSRYDRKPVI